MLSAEIARSVVKISVHFAAVKRPAEDGVDDDLEEPEGKRLRLEIAEGSDGQHIIQQVQEIQVSLAEDL